MDTAPLKSFATKARTDLMKGVAARLDVVLAPGSNARAEQPGSIAVLERVVAQSSRDEVVDRVAYIWFNRIVALRFMDANGYTGVRVVSPEAGKLTGQPQVLSDAKGGDFDNDVVSARTQAAVASLLAPGAHGADPQGVAYGLLVEEYCRFWNKAMPFMFEREGDYTELLIPTGWLAADSVRGRAVAVLTEEVCKDVEVIGWLYQFYISERKDEVFEGFKKNKKAGAVEIPAATQLFTPHWIVRYLVENSLGRLWLLNHPNSRLADQMEYYIAPVNEETDFLRISKPEELKVIDPAVGSGHMLTYAFDLLYAIYEEEGYTPSEIPGLILEHNLYGTEIDPRAGALAAFALTMKAAARRKLFLKSPVQPSICVLENVFFDSSELDYLWSLMKGENIARADADEFWKAYEHADTFGALIQPRGHLIPSFRALIEDAADEKTDELSIDKQTLEKAKTILRQSAVLSTLYSVVVANPPYMGSKQMNNLLSQFMTNEYPDSKSDLFAGFIVRCTNMTKLGGQLGFMTPFVWMFIKLYEPLRKLLLTEDTITTLIQLEYSGFEGATVPICTFTIQRGPNPEYQGGYVRLTDFVGPRVQAPKALEAIQDETKPWFYRSKSRDFNVIPGSPIVYWLGSDLLAVVQRSEIVETIADARQGLSPADKPRFMRYWWEVSLRRTTLVELGTEKWFPYNKGGGFRRWFGNVEHVINWHEDGAEIRAFPRAAIRNSGYYLLPHITWSKVSSGRPSFRWVPERYMFDGAAGALFVHESIAWQNVLGILNSTVIEDVLEAYAPTLNFTEGNIGALPIPTGLKSLDVVTEVGRLVEASAADWSTSETAWGFVGPDIASGPSIEDFFRAFRLSAEERVKEMHALEIDVNTKVAASFGLAERSNYSTDHLGDLALRRNPFATEARSGLSREDLAADLVSFAVGCMFGRYCLDIPGLVLAEEESTLKDFLAQVPTPSFMPDEDNVIPIVDGDWFEDDIVAKFRQFLRAAFGEQHFTENLTFITDSLEVKDLRDYFTKTFYKDHVQRYKKRPIYWLFSSPKGSFNALIYLHRYNPSTVSTVLNDYLREYIKKMEAELSKQEHSVANGAGAREIAASQKEADRIRKVLIELNDYERELYDLASKQISLDLDDGVLVNYQKFGTSLKDIGLKKGGADE